MLSAACGASLKPLEIVTIEETIPLPPAVAVLPLPAPIQEEFPTEWKVVNTPSGVYFALSEEQHQDLILWLTDAARYVAETGSQLRYYRDGLQGEGES